MFFCDAKEAEQIDTYSVTTMSDTAVRKERNNRQSSVEISTTNM